MSFVEGLYDLSMMHGGSYLGEGKEVFAFQSDVSQQKDKVVVGVYCVAIPVQAGDNCRSSDQNFLLLMLCGRTVLKVNRRILNFCEHTRTEPTVNDQP